MSQADRPEAEWHDTESATIGAVGYDRESGVLYVEFRGAGATYAYMNVPADVFSALLTAPSKGAFVNEMIKSRYEYRRL